MIAEVKATANGTSLEPPRGGRQAEPAHGRQQAQPAHGGREAQPERGPRQAEPAPRLDGDAPAPHRGPLRSADLVGRYYRALLERDGAYEGVFYVGVKTTGVFCRPTCPARKPHRENCEFFANARDALHAAYRPCKRCRPLSHPNDMPEVVRHLVAAVEAEPERRWRDRDFRAIGVDESTARRLFKKRYGMTFMEYARARRMGLALAKIREGSSVIDAQLDTGYESGSGFREAFNRIIGAPPSSPQARALSAAWLDTPLGPMLAIADDASLVLLEFVDRRGLETELKRLREGAAIVPGKTAPIASIERELKEYFAGERQHFETPVDLAGTPFQRDVWQQLRRIEPGETLSYAGLATAVGRPSAVRAVARANGANQLAIVIPCHRVITSTGELGGYAGGVPRKQWLLEHERRHWAGADRLL